MPLITPLYDDIPTWSGANYHDTALYGPSLTSAPNYTLHIDASTGRKRTLREFLDRVADGATALTASAGIGGPELKADSGFVGIMSENCIDYPVIVYSLLKIAVPISFIPSLLTPTESVTLLKLSCVTTLFVSSRLLPIALDASKRIGLPEDRIFLLTGHSRGRKSFPDLISFVRSKSIPRALTATVNDDTVAYMMFSSGTSGVPKGVLISHKNIASSVAQLSALALKTAQIYRPLPLDTPEGIPVTLAALPFYHTMGVHTFIFRMLSQPATYVVLSRWDAGRVAEVISQYKITHLPMVPSMAYQLVASPKLAKVDLSRLRYANSGAAYLPPDLRERVIKRARNVPYMSEGYGMSECTNAAVVTPFPGTVPNITSVPGFTGILLPSMKARIIREDGSDADFDEPGELILAGDNVALGYHNNEKATNETFISGWLYTGDRFKVDRDGRFFYCDRVKDTLKVSGTQVSPVEIEDTILAHPERLISDVAVAGVPGARLQDELAPRAWIILSPKGKVKGDSYVANSIENWVHTRLSKPKWLRGGIQFIDEIPKSPTGKVLRRKLQQDYKASLNTSRKRYVPPKL